LQIRTFILYVTQPKGFQQEILVLLRATRPLNKIREEEYLIRGYRVNKKIKNKEEGGGR
jgi:hypothetical protein